MPIPNVQIVIIPELSSVNIQVIDSIAFIVSHVLIITDHQHERKFYDLIIF